MKIEDETKAAAARERKHKKDIERVRKSLDIYITPPTTAAVAFCEIGHE